MASLSVRKIEDDVYEKLKLRAEQHGLSMEEEARRILRRAVAAPESLGQLALRCFGREYGIDLELPPRDVYEPPDLSG